MSSTSEWYPREFQSRLTTRRQPVYHKVLGYVDAVFCLNCGRPYGYVTQGTESIVVVCEPCAKTHGGLPMPEMTQEDLDRIGFQKEEG